MTLEIQVLAWDKDRHKNVSVLNRLMASERRAYEKGGSVGTSVWAPESKQGAYESEGPHSLNHRPFILSFPYFLLVFTAIFSLFRTIIM